ncbi:MAG: hypothetical protein FWH10_01555 [Oscillospiraceae bacterium]|nr:hypothetical protein [Oscillospiraceae bacterium]
MDKNSKNQGDSFIEQLRKIIDTELINVIKNSVYYSPEWSARLYKISESDNKIAFTILFVDCAEAEEIAKNLGEVS